MENPLVSIIVPVYNGEAYIHRCVKSILNQTYKNIEIILVNDGSKDNSKTILDELSQSHSNIKIVHQENKGLVETRHSGIKVATGEYISHVDVDDWIPCDAIENLLKKCIDNNLDYAAGIPDVYFSSTLIKPSPRIAPGIYDHDSLLNRFLMIGGNLPSWASISKRSIWKDDVFPTPRNIRYPKEDLLINVNLSKYIQRGGIFNDIIIYYYFLSPNSLTSLGVLFNLDNWTAFFVELREQLKKRDLLSKYESTIRIMEIESLAFHSNKINKDSNWIQNIYSYPTKDFPLKFKILHTLIKYPELCRKIIPGYQYLKSFIIKTRKPFKNK